MALNITTELQNESGFKTAQTYARIAVVDNIDGKKIQGIVNLFTDKESYDNGLIPFQAKGINNNFEFDYDRNTMSKDILDLAHDVYISYLAEQGIEAEKSL